MPASLAQFKHSIRIQSTFGVTRTFSTGLSKCRLFRDLSRLFHWLRLDSRWARHHELHLRNRRQPILAGLGDWSTRRIEVADWL
jgi:hypothetical protein